MPKEQDMNNISDAMNHLKINGYMNCKELKLNKQNLLTLPVNIQKMNNLCHVEMDENKLENIGDLKYCGNLRILCLKKNKIKDIQCLFALDKLEVIDLRINNITQIAVIVDDKIWPQLHTLQLGHNRLKKVSQLLEKIGSINMSVLDFGNNNIEIFPECIMKWKSLDVLDLSINDISSIPFELGLLDRLNGLMLNGKRLRRMTSVINSGNTKKILQWLKNRL